MSVERAEFTKFRSVASTGWSLLATAGTTVVLGILYARLGVTRSPADRAAFDSAAAVLSGVQLYLTVAALLGLGLGLLLRNTAGAISALFGLLFGPQLVASLLPADIAGHISRYLPEPAGIAVTLDRPGSSLGPWAGLAVFALYAAVVLALGVGRLRRTDV